MMDRDTGVMDTNLYLYEEALGVSFDMDKARRLDYGESKLNHAMVFTERYLSDELREALRQRPIVLPPWDLFGAVALMR